MDRGNTADVFYLDFVKVFLLAKLESFGLCEKVVRWILLGASGRCVIKVDKDQEWGT